MDIVYVSKYAGDPLDLCIFNPQRVRIEGYS